MNYAPKERIDCPICHGSGFKFINENTVIPCECKEGKDRRWALTKPKQEETTKDG